MTDIIEDLIGVVVLYNNTIEESITLTSINRNLEIIKKKIDIIVYDNNNYSEIKNGTIFLHGQLKIHYFHDPTNPGVSKAYNFAANYANNLKKNWLLLLDQDTDFPVDAIDNYILSIKQNPEIKLFAPILKDSTGAIISPCRYIFKRGFPLKRVTTGITSLQNISPLNSGILIYLTTFFLSGGYNELIKLDFSDFQFIERFKKINTYCYIINVECLHNFSNSETNTSKLNNRFIFYCDGAKKIKKSSTIDRFTYFMVVLLRATRLVYRTKKSIFFKTFIFHYLR
ncbi:MAG: glycosyltransferase [Bacteroidetes bacterium]|nr:glycosyltransferase [Bacteroidota bacterium]